MRADKSDGGPSKTSKTQPVKVAADVVGKYQEPSFTGDDATGRRRGNQPAPYRNGAMVGEHKNSKHKNT